MHILPWFVRYPLRVADFCPLPVYAIGLTFVYSGVLALVEMFTGWNAGPWILWWDFKSVAILLFLIGGAGIVVGLVALAVARCPACKKGLRLSRTPDWKANLRLRAELRDMLAPFSRSARVCPHCGATLGIAFTEGAPAWARKARRHVAIALTTTALLLAAFIGINAFDETLNPEPAAALRAPSPRPAGGQNAYAFSLGLFAPLEQDPAASGRGVLAAYEIWHANPLRDGGSEFRQARDAGRRPNLTRVAQVCIPGMAPCLETNIARAAQLEEMLQANQVLFERYQALLRFPTFEETASPSQSGPPLPYESAARLRLLLFSHVSLLVGQGKQSRALDALAEDISFWRRVLASTRNMASKMAANRFLYQDFRYASEIMDRSTTERILAERIVALATPLSDAELDPAPAFRAYFADVADLLSRQALFRTFLHYIGLHAAHPARPDDWGYIPGYKLNATLNLVYERSWSPALELAAAPAQQFAESTRRIEARLADSDRIRYSDAYNPIGRILARVAGLEKMAPRLISRMHDLDGFIRLIGLHAAIKAQAVPISGIPRFLESTDRRFADPYTGRPMRWDPAKRTLGFQGMSGDTWRVASLDVRAD